MSVWLPMATRYGVPYAAFWDMNPKRLKPWQDSFNDKVEADAMMVDYSAWLGGMYVLLAIGAAIDGRKSPYPQKAFMLAEKERKAIEEQEHRDEMAAARFMNWAMEFNKRFAQQEENQDNAESISKHT